MSPLVSLTVPPRLVSLVALSLTTLASGCLYITARPVAEPEYADRRDDLPGNPYDHLAAPEYTKGRIAGFREIYVEPDAFAGDLAPVAELPVTKVEVAEKLALPPELLPAILVKVDTAKIGESRPWDAIAKAVASGRPGLLVSMPTAGILMFKAPLAAGKGAQAPAVDPKAVARLQKELESLVIGGEPLAKMATVGVVGEYPAEVTSGYPMPPQENLVVVAPAPPPPPPGPTRGTIPVDNVTTSYAWVSVNGKKVGVIPPLARARIRDVKAGVYEVGFLLPNAFEWTERLATRTDLEARVNLDADRILLAENVHFDTNSAQIQPVSTSLLDEIAVFLQEHPELTRVRVEGHTDADGDAESNQKLSEERSEAVLQALVQRGVSPARLVAAGFGESRPVQKGEDEAAKAANRRVELHVQERK